MIVRPVVIAVVMCMTLSAGPVLADEASPAARAELAVVQTVHGAILGVQGCLVLGCEGAAMRLTLPALGAAAGLTGALVASRHVDIDASRVAGLHTGIVWGGWIGLTGAVLSGTGHRGGMGAMMAGQLLGGAAGWLLSGHVSPGALALVNGAAAWSAVLYLLVAVGVLEIAHTPQAGMGAALGVGAAFGAGGWLLAQHHPVSRGRVAIVSGGGLLGALVGFGAAALATGEDGRRITLGGAAAGALTGLTTAAWLTRGTEGGGPAGVGVSLSPGPGGDGVVGVVAGRF